MFERQPSAEPDEGRGFFDVLLKKVDEEKTEVRTALRAIDAQQQMATQEKEFVNYGSEQFARKRAAASKKRKARKNEDDSSDDAFATNDDMPINVSLKDPKRFDVYSAQKEARLEKLRRDQLEAEMQNLKPKPDITPYKFAKERVPMHQRNFNKEAQNKQLLLAEAKREAGSQQYRDCTFSPDLRRSVGEDSLERDRGKTVEELLEWKRERDGRMALLRMETVDKDANECTFKPKLNSKSKQIMSQYEQGTMPIKQSKKEYVEEFLKREKSDNFKPRINSKTHEILQKGYRPAAAQVKQLKPAYLLKQHEDDQNRQRSKSVRRSSRSASKDNHHLKSLTEQEIIERFRTEAHPSKPRKKLGSLYRRPVSSSRNLSSSANKAPGSPANIARNKSSSAIKIRNSSKSDNRGSVDALQTRPLGSSQVRVELASKKEFDRADKASRRPDTPRTVRRPQPAEHSSPSRSPDHRQITPGVKFAPSKQKPRDRSASKESVEARERVRRSKERMQESHRQKVDQLFYKDGSTSPPRSRPAGSPKPRLRSSSKRVK